MISPEEIQRIYQDRKKERAVIFGRWQEVIDSYNGDISVQVAELDENKRSTVVNLFPGGVDALATRAASVQPDQSWPSLRDGFQGSEDRAHDRREAGLGWWSMNDIALQDRLRYRYFFAFGMDPVTILPVSASPFDKREIPHWRTRNPLMSFPAPCDDSLNMEPADIIFACKRTRAWLQERYPAALAQLSGGPREQQRRDDTFDVLEYLDCDEMVLVCCGRDVSPGTGLWTPYTDARSAAAVLLERTENRAGITLAVAPGRITLDRLQGALDQMIPAHRQAARLNALNELAIVRGIFQNEWLQGHPNDPQSPEIITYANGMTGVIGEVAHGSIVAIGPAVGAAQMADMAIDRLERSQRVVGNLPSETNGESGSNIRTAKRGEQVLGSAIDMPIQEAQDIHAASKAAELRRGVAVMKGWFGPKKTSFYVSRDGKLPKLLDYTPDETFETDENYVKFSLAGTDANSMVVAILQRTQGGIISQQTGREMDPAVEDPELERDRVEIEGIRRALLTSLENAATQGQLGPDQIALIAKIKWATHGELEDVVLEAHKQTQANQAAQQQMAPSDPNAQPGLGGAQPPAGGPPSPFGGAPSSPALAQILGSLAQPAKQGQAEAAQVQPPQPAMAGS